MKTMLAAIVLSATAAFAVAGYYFKSAEQPAASTGSPGTNTFDASQPVEARIEALERAVSDERFARQLLQEEVFYLTNELERLTVPEPFEPPAPDGAEAGGESEPALSRSERRRRSRTPEGRIELLVDAGFLPSQAEWITQREQELQMEALQSRFDAERNGEDIDWMADRTMASDKLREELGDADYERYLEANDRSTSVAVSSVIESSPAQTAGLMPGDQIIRYDGQRVFSMTDLTRQTMDGEPGQTVVVDVMRNGNLMQVVMPRGPVGITGGRRRF
jgi:hypothetical protein